MLQLRHSSEAATESPLSTGRGAGDMDVEVCCWLLFVFFFMKTSKAVVTWLSGLGLEEHQGQFRSNQINGVALLLLNENDLRNMGVDKVFFIGLWFFVLREKSGWTSQAVVACDWRASRVCWSCAALSKRRGGRGGLNMFCFVFFLFLSESAQVVQVGGTDGTLHRRIAKKQEADQEVYLKAVFKVSKCSKKCAFLLKPRSGHCAPHETGS